MCCGCCFPSCQVTLSKGDYTVLHRLLSHKVPFHFGKRTFEALLLSAINADVELQELQALMQLVPPSTISNRAYFSLISLFMSQQQYLEAMHCYQQVLAAGLRLTPAMEQQLQVLKNGRLVGGKTYK